MQDPVRRRLLHRALQPVAARILCNRGVVVSACFNSLFRHRFFFTVHVLPSCSVIRDGSDRKLLPSQLTKLICIDLATILYKDWLRKLSCRACFLDHLWIPHIATLMPSSDDFAQKKAYSCKKECLIGLAELGSLSQATGVLLSLLISTTMSRQQQAR